MWAKLEVVPGDQKIIYLPPSLSKEGESTTLLQFGGTSITTKIQYHDDLESTSENSFETPAKIVLSDKLKKELSIEESLVYQVKIYDSQIMIGPVIGLLLGKATKRYNPVHMLKYSDRFGIYPRIGGLVYAFSPNYINWRKRTIYGLYYNYQTASWVYGCFPFPEVIYRRDFHSEPQLIQKLIKCTNGNLFNSYRFTKYELFDLLKQNDQLRRHLPPTEYSLEFGQIKNFINQHQKVILKPIHLSRGRGICIIEKIDSKYKVIDFRCKHPITYELYDDSLLETFFEVYQDLFDKYLIQQYLHLAKVNHSPFDIRVVMQKQPDKNWGCTGVECRVSNNGYLTNISRGGYALPLDKALQQSFPANQDLLQEQVFDLCQKFCRYLDTTGEHFAEYGLDIAIDTRQKVWLIEANVFPSFKGFKKMEPDTYLSIRYTPLLYATSLTEFSSY